jgi:hypothetical protein
MHSNTIRDEDFIYNDLPPEIVAEKANTFKAILSKFLEKSKLEREDIRCEDSLIFRIITRIDQRKDYYSYFHSEVTTEKQDLRQMSEVKTTALWCYWLIKYKPIIIIDKYKSEMYFQNNSCTVNEALAAYIFTSFIVTYNEHCKKDYYKSSDYMRDIYYSFMNEEISKEALIFSLGSLTCIR